MIIGAQALVRTILNDEQVLRYRAGAALGAQAALYSTPATFLESTP